MKLFVLALVLGGSVSAFSQVRFAKAEVKPEESRRLQELSTELKKNYEIKYAEAVRLAELNNWPLVIKGENDKVSTLTKVENGVPYYTSADNVGSAITSRTNHLQPGGSLALNLTGEFSAEEPMVVGVWDGGYPRATHNDLTGRTSQGDNGGEVNFHPTHVTGTIIGSGASKAAAKGMAPKAYTTNYTYASDGGEMADFALFGYVLSNHSYGIDQTQFPEEYLQQYRGTYDSYSREVDQIMFDAPYYQPVFAAGNDGDGVSYDRLTDRSVSKNGIAVAAVYEVDDYADETSVLITGFSSFGPTNDKRIKPDISTKGINVNSCSNSSNTAHEDSQGTSMACPGITGTLTLLQQYYSILHPSTTGTRNFMKSATVRALVAHSADEAGLAPGPDPVYGWGLMNAKRAAEILAADSQNTSADIRELVLTPGQTYTFDVNASGTEPLIVTMAWTDPAAPEANNGSSAVTLINNLDVKVIKGATTYYPWKLDSSGEFAINTADNNVDNIEKIEVPNATGAYTITVKHKKTTLVNPNGDAQQEYSLILSGITGVPAGLEDINDKMFSVWPNPANDVLNISFANGVEQGASATIYDVQGRLVRNTQLMGTDNVIGVQDLAKGLYIVSVTNGGKTEVEKVIIK